ncbi:MAG: PhzF family phenazine biosynthesis protein [Rhizobiaceae bacterium]
MPEHDYAIYDVFTDERLTGNPLAVVFDASDLDKKAMQRIAGEFNLSETAFISPPNAPHHTARVNIFTPKLELPFAGHPTVGSAVALVERGGLTRASGEGAILAIEEEIGMVRCVVSQEEDIAAFAEFDLPRLPGPVGLTITQEIAAACLGLGPHEVGFENHLVSAWSAGVPYVCIPVAGLGAAAKARLDAGLWLENAPRHGGLIASPYVYCRDTVGRDCAFHARMFAPYDGIAEDPATGSAAAAFAAAVMRFDQPVDGPSELWIEQGVEMGRPSRIRVALDVENGRLTGARIGGHAVKVDSGKLVA